SDLLKRNLKLLHLENVLSLVKVFAPKPQIILVLDINQLVVIQLLNSSDLLVIYLYVHLKYLMPYRLFQAQYSYRLIMIVILFLLGIALSSLRIYDLTLPKIPILYTTDQSLLVLHH